MTMDNTTSGFLDEFLAPAPKQRDLLTLDLTGLEADIAQ